MSIKNRDNILWVISSNIKEYDMHNIDPETNTLRNYYPDFIIKLVDGSYIIIEVKADFKVDDPVVMAKANATKEIVTDKGMDYMLVESSRVEKERIKFALT